MGVQQRAALGVPGRACFLQTGWRASVPPPPVLRKRSKSKRVIGGFIKTYHSKDFSSSAVLTTVSAAAIDPRSLTEKEATLVGAGEGYLNLI